MISFVVYASALGPDAEFTYDDDAIVRNSPRLVVRSLADVDALVWGKYWGEAYRSERLWRPVPLLSFALDRALFGRGPRGFHFTNVLLHALTSVLTLLWLRRVLNARRLALAGALLFATHPVHAEAVVGIVGRSEVLALLGAVAGHVLHLRARRTSTARGLGLYLLGACCFLLAFCSKEIALTAPFVLALVEVVARRPASAAGRLRRWASFWGPYLLYALVIVGYFALRWYALTRGLQSAEDAALFPTQSARTLGALSLVDRFLVANLTVRDALGALLAPGTTSAVYALPFDWRTGPKLGDASVIASIVLHTVLLGGATFALRARRSRGVRALGLAVWGFYLSMGPISNLIPIGVVRADRLLYTPSIYACLGLAAGLGLLRDAARRSGRDAAILPIAAILLFGFCLRLAGNARAWCTNRALWETSLSRFDPPPTVESARCHLALGKQLLGDPLERLEARRHFESAILGMQPPKRWQRYAAEARWGLATTYLAEDPELARTLLEAARTLDPASRSVALGLATLHLTDADRATTPELKLRALHLAEQAARAGVRFATTDYDLWLLYGTILSRLQGRTPEAEAAYTRAVERSDFPWQALVNRARLRFSARRFSEALDDFRAVTALLDPLLRAGALSQEMRTVLPDALFHRAVLALEQGARGEARWCVDTLRAAFPAHDKLGALEAELRKRGG